MKVRAAWLELKQREPQFAGSRILPGGNIGYSATDGCPSETFQEIYLEN